MDADAPVGGLQCFPKLVCPSLAQIQSLVVEKVLDTIAVDVDYLSRIGSGIVNTEFGRVLYKERPR